MAPDGANMTPMMKRLVVIAVALAFLAPAGGCIIRTQPNHSHHTVKAKPKCKPSQYWDGHRCRHKGKGKGARKHDD
jgi:hypothetical protein